MGFPSYVHSILPDSDESAWPVQGQGVNECGCTVAANALNLLVGRKQFEKDDFVREAGIFFNRGMGGTPSPITAHLIKRHGFGTHFGNLTYTDAELVLRHLIDLGVPVSIEIGSNRVGPWVIYGQHAMLLVGYSDPYRDADGVLREEYYFVDSQWPEIGKFNLNDNNVTVNGHTTYYPGNRTMSREEFLRQYETRIYFPVFRSQADHDAWYATYMRPVPSVPLIGRVRSAFFTGSYDAWVGRR
jgi:hypothetical protein